MRAVIVVDLQNDYFPGGKCSLTGIEAAVENAAHVISAARSFGEPVIHVRHEFTTQAAPFFAAGSNGAAINTKVLNEKDEKVIVKNQINAFQDTQLKKILDEKQIDAIAVCGAMSDMCIDAIVRAASDFGYKVSVVHDACATKDAEFNGVKVPAAMVHATAMSALGFGYATMVTAKEYAASCR